MDYQLQPLGENAVVIVLGDEINDEIHKKVQLVSLLLDQFEWYIEYIPAYTTVTVVFDPLKISMLADNRFLPFQYVCSEIHKLLTIQSEIIEVEQRVIEIPIC